MKIKKILQNAATALLTISLFGCYFSSPGQPDPRTGRFNTSPFPKEKITINRSVNLKNYAFLLIRGDEYFYQAAGLKNLHAFPQIITAPEFGHYLIDEGYTSQNYDYYTVSETELMGINPKLRFLVLDVSSIPGIVGREIHYQIFDPYTNETYFSTKFHTADMTSAANYNSALNAVADWFSRN